nr:probable protein arginine N-methyltransferase 3 [Tanacetum cinerariifolium]
MASIASQHGGRLDSGQIEPHSVDVLVSEWMRYCLLYETMPSYVLVARDHWLKLEVPCGAVEHGGKPDSGQIEPHSVDVLVSEWMRYCLLYETMPSYVLVARDHWLKPEVPCGAVEVVVVSGIGGWRWWVRVVMRTVVRVVDGGGSLILNVACLVPEINYLL